MEEAKAELEGAGGETEDAGEEMTREEEEKGCPNRVEDEKEKNGDGDVHSLCAC